MIQLLLILPLLTATPQTHSIEDVWITTDDETGLQKSEVVFYQEGGKLYGKIETLLLPEDQGKLCVNCEGALKNQPIAGLVIVNQLIQTKNGWEDGTILDPKSGKEYDCYIEFIDENTLKVRGFIGFSLLGRTQIWKRKI